MGSEVGPTGAVGCVHIFWFINEVINDVEYGAKSTMTAIMGRMATYTGKKITWDQAINSKEMLVPNNLTWNSTPPTLPDDNGKYLVAIPGKTQFI